MTFEAHGNEEHDIKIQLENEPVKPVTAPSQPTQKAQDNSGNAITNLFKAANHPAVCIMHVIFKLAALLL